MIFSLKKLISLFNRSSLGVCSICDETFSDKELTVVDALSFCPYDTKLYNQYNWSVFRTTNSNPDNPDDALELQILKAKFKKFSIPSFIVTDYFEKDNYVITQFQLFLPSKLLQEAEKQLLL